MARSRPGLAALPLGTPPDRVTGRFVALAPGEAAPLYAFEFPSGVTGQPRLRIAARQLADRIGAGAERPEIHPLGAGSWTRAVVVAPQAAAAWRRDPLLADRRCRALWPDYLALPAAANLVVADVEGGRVRVRIGTDDAFSAPAALAGPLLKTSLDGGAFRAALVTGDAGASDLRVQLKAAGLPVAESAEALVALGFAPPAPVEPVGLDLRVDPGRAGDRMARELALWSVPAVLLVAAIGLWSAGVLVETRALRAETAEVRDATVARLRQGLIPEGPILDIRAQVSQARSGQTTGDGTPDPMALLRRAAEALAETGGKVGAVALEPGGSLSVTLTASDFDAVERLVDALRALGLSAEAASARAAEAGVEARLAIAGGAG